MGIAGDLILITTDARNGRSLLGSTEADAVLGGALLVDLVVAGRCAVEGAAKKARVRLVTTTPLGSPAHDRALSRLRPGKDAKASSVVPRLGKGARQALQAELAAQGVLAERTEKVALVFTTTRYDVADPARQQAVLAPVLDVLLGRAEPDETTGPLVGLLSAADVVGKLVPSAERKAAKRRAKEIAKGQWAGAAADAAVQAAQAAVTAAITAAIVASSASAGGASGS